MGSPRVTLVDAARNGRYGQARLIVEAGADVNGRTDGGDTALIISCDPDADLNPQTRINIVKLLMEAGADSNCQNLHGRSALMNAANLGCRQIISLLVNNSNTKAGLQDCEGNTALMLAAANGHPDVVTSILSPWTKLHQMYLLQQVDRRGHTAAQRASEHGHNDIAVLLGGSGGNGFFKMQTGHSMFPSQGLLDPDTSPSPSSSPDRAAVCYSPRKEPGHGQVPQGNRRPSKSGENEFEKVLKFLDAAIRREDASWDGKDDDSNIWSPGISTASENFAVRGRRPRLGGENFFPPIRNGKAASFLNDKFLKKKFSQTYTTDLHLA